MVGVLEPTKQHEGMQRLERRNVRDRSQDTLGDVNVILCDIMEVPDGGLGDIRVLASHSSNTVGKEY